MEFEKITKLAGMASILLWGSAAFVLAYGGSTSAFSFGIVGLLAVLAQAISVNSARREGMAKTGGPINRFLEKVGR